MWNGGDNRSSKLTTGNSGAAQHLMEDYGEQTYWEGLYQGRYSGKYFDWYQVQYRFPCNLVEEIVDIRRISQFCVLISRNTYTRKTKFS
jgi:hypothetical protein